MIEANTRLLASEATSRLPVSNFTPQLNKDRRRPYRCRHYPECAHSHIGKCMECPQRLNWPLSLSDSPYFAWPT